MTDSIRALRAINLNHLPILAELLRCRNVTHAAALLNLTQSTVSGALRQLREIFKDDLLVQKGREMQLTERARRLAPEVEQLIELSCRLLVNDSFDPSTAESNFHVATADYVSALVASRISKVFQAQAPKISLTLSPTPGTSAKELRLGTLDLIICPNRNANWEACGLSKDDPDFEHEVFSKDEWVAIQWSGHPSAGRDLNPEEYFARPHAVYCRTDGRNTIEQDTIERLNVQQNSRFLVPYFTLLPQIVVGSDLIAVIPRSLATQYSRSYEIEAFKLPYTIPPLELAMIWTVKRSSNSGLQWLRGVIKRVVAEEDVKRGRPKGDSA